MKFKRNLFLNTVVLCCVCFLLNTNPASATKDCKPGTYGAMAANCRTCPIGCYCPQNGQDQTCLISETRLAKACSMRDENLGGSGEKCALNSYVLLCPADYPQSEMGAKQEGDCYKDTYEGREYKEIISCKPGEYLPADEDKCKSCSGLDLGNNEYCPGRIYHKHSTKKQGIETCPDGEVAKKNKKGCENDSLTCGAGYYFDGADCIVCPKGSECPGTDKIKKSEKKQQGITSCKGDTISESTGSAKCEKCPDGQKANSTHTACVDSSLKPGYYFKKGKDNETSKCTDLKNDATAWYCPGGEFAQSEDEEIGKFECPKGTRQNKKGTACQLGITKDQMLYGSGGKGTPVDSQCWTKAGEPEKYRECIFNNRYYK